MELRKKIKRNDNEVKEIAIASWNFKKKPTAYENVKKVKEIAAI